MGTENKNKKEILNVNYCKDFLMIFKEKNIAFILNKLNEYGKGYLVGGAVRDKLLNIHVKDYDFATNIDYEKLKQIFKEFCPVELGKKFGVLEINIDNKIYEIAKFRREDNYKKHRYPNTIEFIDDIKIDLHRRDFTINALAYNPINNEIIDLFNGKEDLNNKIIRFIGNPNKRIIEDALRILRAIRFATVLNFNIELLSLKAMTDNCDLVRYIPEKKMKEEIEKIKLSKNSEYGFLLLKNLNIML